MLTIVARNGARVRRDAPVLDAFTEHALIVRRSINRNEILRVPVSAEEFDLLKRYLTRIRDARFKQTMAIPPAV